MSMLRAFFRYYVPWIAVSDSPSGYDAFGTNVLFGGGGGYCVTKFVYSDLLVTYSFY